MTDNEEHQTAMHRFFRFIALVLAIAGTAAIGYVGYRWFLKVLAGEVPLYQIGEAGTVLVMLALFFWFISIPEEKRSETFDKLFKGER